MKQDMFAQYRFAICIVIALLIVPIYSRYAESGKDLQSAMRRWQQRLSKRQATGFTNNNLFDAGTNCGEDLICHSDLKVKAVLEMEQSKTGQNKWNIGQKSILFIYGVVSNTGEDAADTTLTIEHPEFIKFDRVGQEGRMFRCSSIPTKLVCSLGNLMRENNQITFGIKFYALPPTSPQVSNFEVSLSVDTASEEINPIDNVSVIKVNV